jgi:hypothetical protein
VPTCCTELADHNGALAHERAAHAAAPWVRRAQVGSLAPALVVAAGVANGIRVVMSGGRKPISIPVEIITIDSAVMRAYVSRQRCHVGVHLPPAVVPH